MAITQTNVLHGLTASVIQGLVNSSTFQSLLIAPGFAQDGLSANWPIIELAGGEMLRNSLEDRAPGAGFKQVDAKISLDTSTLKGKGLEMAIDKSISADQSKNGLSILNVYGRELINNALRGHESVVAGLAQGSGFDSVNSTVAYTSGNKGSMDLAEDLVGAIERVNGRGEMATDVIIPVDVWNRLRFSDLLKSFIVGSIGAGALVTPSNLQKAFAEDGIKRVLIGNARVNNAAKNKENIVPVWGTSHIWVGSTSESSNGVAGQLGGAMATFYSDENPAPYFLETYYCDKTRSDVLRVFGEVNAKVINARAGTRIATQYS